MKGSEKAMKEDRTYFIERTQGRYICGYRDFNGYRDVNYYVSKIYKNNYVFTLDYTHAKQTSYKTAKKHVNNLMYFDR